MSSKKVPYAFFLSDVVLVRPEVCIVARRSTTVASAEKDLRLDLLLFASHLQVDQSTRTRTRLIVAHVIHWTATRLGVDR